MNVGTRFILSVAALMLLSSVTFAADLVYIPLGSSDAIVSVDPVRGSVVSRIEGMPAVHGLAATPDGKYLIAGSYKERSISEAAPPKPAAVGEDEHAAHHAKGPEASKKSASVLSTVSVIQVKDKSIIRRIDVPGAVHHVAVSPDGRVAVVTHPNEGSISAIDLVSYRVVATLPTGPQPNYAVFSPDSSRLYVSNAGNDTVSNIDASRWIVLRNIVVGEGPEHVVLSRNGQRLYVNNVNGGTVSEIDTATDKVLRSVKVGSVLHGIDLSTDGETVFVAALGDDKIVAVDLATGKVRSAPLGPQPYHLAVIPDVGKIYVSSVTEPKVWVLDPKTLEVTGEIQIGDKGHQMTRAAGG